MRILIYGINYAPELTGIGKYSGEMAEWLAAQGHEVRVVTAPPYYPEWKIATGYSGKRYQYKHSDGVDIWRCPLYVPSKLSGLKRIIHLASFALSSFPVMLMQLLWKPDVVFAVEPPLFCSPATVLVARLSGAKCWLHIQDFEVDAAFALGLIRFSWLKKLVGAVERWLMRRFDRVSSISRSMVLRLQDKGVPKDNVFLFPNWTDIQEVQYDKENAKAFRQRHGISEDTFLVLYSGNMGEKQGLEIVLDVAERISDNQDILFLLCGDGTVKNRLAVRAENMALHNLKFLPLQPKESLPGVLSAANAHLVIQKSKAADLMLPSKLTNILAVGGTAIITTDPNTDMGLLARNHPGVVCTCQPDDPVELEKAILGLIAQKNGQDCFNAKAREYAETFLDKKKILGAFMLEVRAVLQ